MLVEKMNERRLLRHKSTVWIQVYLHYIMPAPDWNACFRAQMGRARLFRRTLPTKKRPVRRKRRIRRLRLAQTETRLCRRGQEKCVLSLDRRLFFVLPRRSFTHDPTLGFGD